MAKNMSVEEIDFTGARLLAIPTLTAGKFMQRNPGPF
jgi:hypothetical protein